MSDVTADDTIACCCKLCPEMVWPSITHCQSQYSILPCLHDGICLSQWQTKDLRQIIMLHHLSWRHLFLDVMAWEQTVWKRSTQALQKICRPHLIPVTRCYLYTSVRQVWYDIQPRSELCMNGFQENPKLEMFKLNGLWLPVKGNKKKKIGNIVLCDSI